MSSEAATNDALLGAQLTEQYHRATGGMVEVLKFGAMLMRLEELLSPRVDSKHSGSGRFAKGTGLKAWLAEHAPDVSVSTAKRLKAVAENVALEYKDIVGAKVAKQITLADLACTPSEELSEPMRAKQMELFDFVRGTSQRSWLPAFRKEHGHAIREGNGGFHPNAALLREWLREHAPEHMDAEFHELPAELQKQARAGVPRYAERLTREQKAEIEEADKARRANATAAAEINAYRDSSLWLRASDEELAAIITATTDLLAALTSHAKGRKDNR